MSISVESVFQSHVRLYIRVFIHLMQELGFFRSSLFLLLLFLKLARLARPPSLLIERNCISLHLICPCLLLRIGQIDFFLAG